MRRRIFWIVAAAAIACLVGIVLVVHKSQQRRTEAAYRLLLDFLVGWPLPGPIAPVTEEQVREFFGEDSGPAARGAPGPVAPVTDDHVRERLGPDGLRSLLQTEERLGKIGQALGAYGRDHGGLPDTLAALAEKGYIDKETIVDPATGKAFYYRKPIPVLVISCELTQAYRVDLFLYESGGFLVLRGAKGLMMQSIRE